MSEKEPKLRDFHAAKWDEPVIMEMSRPGERGIVVSGGDSTIKQSIGDPQAFVPAQMRRKALPRLPELSQPHVLRHFLRLSQETMGQAIAIDFRGTCTMKYTPIIEFESAGLLANTHPFQDEDTVQGTLEIIHRFAQILTEISGMDEFTFQPGGGGHGVFTNACIIREYHKERKERDRDEMITTLYSHPANAASPATAGFKIITLHPDPETGYPSVEALKAAVSNRTAGLMITNPEDTGIFNPEIDEFTKIIHEAGGLCSYDQANSNSLFGLVRARESGFDMCHFNTHKAFSTPHGSNGPAAGAVGVRSKLAEYLPVPVVTFDGQKYHLEYDRPKSIGKIRGFSGNVPLVLMAYAWVMNLGAEGLRQVSTAATVNANYIIHKLKSVKGLELAYPKKRWRLDQARFGFGKLKEDTGVGTEDIRRRIVDYGIADHFTSHEPWIPAEPIIPEPTDSYSKEDIDYWVAGLRRVCEEAYRDPKLVLSAPHNVGIPKMRSEYLNDPKKWAMTWRKFKKRRELEAGKESPSKWKKKKKPARRSR